MPNQEQRPSKECTVVNKILTVVNDLTQKCLLGRNYQHQSLPEEMRFRNLNQVTSYEMWFDLRGLNLSKEEELRFGKDKKLALRVFKGVNDLHEPNPGWSVKIEKIVIDQDDNLVGSIGGIELDEQSCNQSSVQPDGNSVAPPSSRELMRLLQVKCYEQSLIKSFIRRADSNSTYKLMPNETSRVE